MGAGGGSTRDASDLISPQVFARCMIVQYTMDCEMARYSGFPGLENWNDVGMSVVLPQASAHRSLSNKIYHKVHGFPQERHCALDGLAQVAGWAHQVRTMHSECSVLRTRIVTQTPRSRRSSTAPLDRFIRARLVVSAASGGES